jgi:hypothetical protein
MLPDFERADRIGELWGYPESRAFADRDAPERQLAAVRRSTPLVSLARFYTPKTWNVIVRSFGSSISNRINLCHVPNAGSPAVTGIA